MWTRVVMWTNSITNSMNPYFSAASNPYARSRIQNHQNAMCAATRRQQLRNKLTPILSAQNYVFTIDIVAGSSVALLGRDSNHSVIPIATKLTAISSHGSQSSNDAICLRSLIKTLNRRSLTHWSFDFGKIVLWLH